MKVNNERLVLWGGIGFILCFILACGWPIFADLGSALGSAIGSLIPDKWDRGPHTTTLKGHYYSNLEESSFQPCGSEEKWWVELGPVSYLVLQDHDAPVRLGVPTAGSYTYVVFHGTYTDKGQYGHSGQYKRKFSVDALEEVRTPRPDDCP